MHGRVGGQKQRVRASDAERTGTATAIIVTLCRCTRQRLSYEPVQFVNDQSLRERARTDAVGSKS